MKNQMNWKQTRSLSLSHFPSDMMSSCQHLDIIPNGRIFNPKMFWILEL